MSKQKMVIMSYETAEVHVVPYDPEQPVPEGTDDIDHSEAVFIQWCEERDIRPKDCYYMTGDIAIHIGGASITFNQ